jgi:hypothetical protein
MGRYFGIFIGGELIRARSDVFGVDSLLVFIPGYIVTSLKTPPQKFRAQARYLFLFCNSCNS